MSPPLSAPPPPPFRLLRPGRSTLWVRPGAEDRIRELLDGSPSLHAGAGEEARPGGPRTPLRGRGPVHLIPGADAGERWAVRHYHRGGLLAPLTGDRYLRSGSLPRPLAEAAASEECRRRGVRTPLVMAAAVYGRGPVYRGDLVTRYIPESCTLADLLREEADPKGLQRREAGLRLSLELVRELAHRGIRHMDLNARNILLRPGAAPRAAFVLDLDRVRVSPRRAALSPEAMWRRLERSLAKLEARGHLVLTPEERSLLAFARR